MPPADERSPIQTSFGMAAAGEDRLAPARCLARLWKQPSERRSIAIRNQEGHTVGELLPIDSTRAADSQIIEAMTRWRRQHRDSFFSQFAPSYERTARWLQSYLTSDSRLLFLICDPVGRPVGNVGLCGLQDDAAELDNVMRAEPVTVPRMGFLATSALLDWWFSEIPTTRLTLRVFADNQRAVALYDALGFSRQGLVPVIAESVGDEVRYRPATSAEAPGATKFWLSMSLAYDAVLADNVGGNNAATGMALAGTLRSGAKRNCVFANFSNLIHSVARRTTPD